MQKIALECSQNKIKRILAVRTDRYGEFLLNIPAFRALKQSFPGSTLTLAVNPYVAELARCIDFVDDIIIWENRRHTLKEVIKFSKELKNMKFYISLALNPSKDFNIASFFAGIPIRVGYNRKWGFLLNLKKEDKKSAGDKHELSYNLELVALVGANTEDKTLSIKIPENIVNSLSILGIKESEGFFVIHPWTSDPVKQWPLENFRELAIKLLGYHKLKVVIVGGKEEADKSREIFAGLGPGVLNLTGKTTLLQLAVVLKRCKLLISGDSGPVHLASAVGTPVLALFRNDIPGKTSKRWGPWGAGHAVIEKRKLSDINVDEVFYKTKEMIER